MSNGYINRNLVCPSCNVAFSSSKPNTSFCQKPECQKFRKRRNRQKRADKGVLKKPPVVKKINPEGFMQEEMIANLTQELLTLKDSYDDLLRRFVIVQGAYAVARERGDI